MADRQTTGQADRPTIIISSDHAGFELKEQLKGHLASGGYEIEDLQPVCRPGDDYPLVAGQLGKAVAARAGAFGVVVCGTGNGAAMAANKVPGVRAALLYSEEAAAMARRHNDANVAAFGGRTMTFEQASSYLDAFLAARPEGGRHGRRVEQLSQMDEQGRATP